MRISDWSSDVCSSDLAIAQRHNAHLVGVYGVSHENAHPTETFARGTAAIRDVLTRQRLADEQKIIAAARHFGELAREYGIGSEFRIVWRDDLSAAGKRSESAGGGKEWASKVECRWRAVYKHKKRK